jgi:hypothetical protein
MPELGVSRRDLLSHGDEILPETLLEDIRTLDNRGVLRIEDSRILEDTANIRGEIGETLIFEILETALHRAQIYKHTDKLSQPPQFKGGRGTIDIPMGCLTIR